METVDSEDVAILRQKLAEVQVASAAALDTSLVSSQEKRVTGHELRDVRDRLRTLHAETHTALSRVENELSQVESGPDPTSRITTEHSDRWRERVDDPHLELLIGQMIERNRWEYLWRQPETNGAEAVRMHGLTGTQRQAVEQLLSTE